MSICDNIYEGARPGYEEGYIVTKNIIKKHNLEPELIKPFIKTEDVDAFLIKQELDKKKKYIIFPYDEQLNLVDIDLYPNTKKYLENFRGLLYDNKGKDDSYLRYEYYHCPKEFLKNERIITPDISNKNEFVLDKKGKYIFPNTLYALSINKKVEIKREYILGVLNSQLVEFYIKNKSPSIRGGYFRYKTEYLERIPLPKIYSEKIYNISKKLMINNKILYKIIQIWEDTANKIKRFCQVFG